MSVSCFRRKTCRLCGSNKVVLGAQLVATPPGDIFLSPDQLNKKEEEFPLDIFLCEGCGCIQLLDIVDPDFIYTNYIYRTEVSLGLSDYFRGYADDVLSFVAPRQGDLVIDIGSNDGTLLRYFKTKGLKVLGVDPAPVAQKATESGIETLQVFFKTTLAKELRKTHGAPALVTANNVVANIDDLGDFFLGIKELIGQEGCFVFETGYGFDLVNKKLLDIVFHEHISYFTVGALYRSLPRFGLQLIHVQHTASKGGCIRCYIQGEKGPRKVQSSVAQMIKMETGNGIEKVEAFKPFNDFIAETRKRLTRDIRSWKEQGKIVAGYGASVSTTTLVHLFDLGDKVEYVVDDNPDRFGLFTPRHHIPVFPSKTLYEKKPDYVIVFAWRYLDMIMKRHENFISQGGHFLTFLPQYKIY